LKAYEKKEEKEPEEDVIDVDQLSGDEEELEVKQSAAAQLEKIASEVSIKEERAVTTQGLITKETKQMGNVSFRDLFAFASYGIG
jgi:hypothetical protein